MPKTYITKQGDTFDSIAYSELGNEYLFIDLLEANVQYRDVIIFDSVIEIVIPDVEVDDFDNVPEWLEEIEEDEEVLEDGDGESW